jgi:hypothetical protein
MVEVHCARPAVDQRLRIQVFYATNPHARLRNAWGAQAFSLLVAACCRDALSEVR